MEFTMKTFLILTMTIAAVNCGLLKQLVEPVTDSVHKGELFNQKEQKDDGKETKGVLDKLVNNLDAGAEKLVSALTGGLNPEELGALKKNANETKDDNSKVSEKPDVSKVPDVNGTEKVDVNKGLEVKDLDSTDSTTLPAVDKDNEVKADEATTPKIDGVKPEEASKEVKDNEVTTPKVDEIKPEETANKVEETKA